MSETTGADPDPRGRSVRQWLFMFVGFLFGACVCLGVRQVFKSWVGFSAPAATNAATAVCVPAYLIFLVASSMISRRRRKTRDDGTHSF